MAKVQKYSLILWVLVFAGVGLHAQPQESLSKGEVWPLFSLDTFDSEQTKSRQRVPFIVSDQKRWDNFSFEWVVDCDLPDTVFFYVKGLAWNADLYLNGQFISSMDNPLDAWVVPLSILWIQEGKNTLTLTCRYSTYFPNYPKPFLGLLQPIQIYEHPPDEDQPKSSRYIASNDSVWVWAPYFGEAGFTFEKETAQKELFHMKRTALRHIYFPFPPPAEQVSLALAWGFLPVDSLKEGTYVAMLNTYPYEPVGFSFPLSFWLDEGGRRTSHYGQFLSWVPKDYPTLPLNPGVGTVFILLFPFLALLGVKFINPNFYYSLERIFSKPDKYIDTLNDSSSGSGGFAFVVILINQLAFSILLFLFVYYIYRSHSWETMTLLRERSLLTRFFYPIENVHTIFWRSFLIVAGSFLFKYLFLGILGSIFSIRNLVSGTINLDIIGNFPYLQGLSIPLLLLLLYPEDQRILWGLFLFLGAIIFFRKMYTYFYGLERLFNFSSGVKILYICAFNILPYIIWF
ncbi:MAG: DUF4271 domain-containing protein [Bacteroidota bacterium]